MVAHTAVSTHLPPAKDRALATALMRLSDRTEAQQRTHAEKVIYCGSEEPIYGWTNAIPNPKYMDISRPKAMAAKKRKGSRKPPKVDPERYDSPEPSQLAYQQSAIPGADGQYNMYANLRDMYDNYKKNMKLRQVSRRYDIIDPVTFRYIPWNERVEYDDGYSSDGSEVKLPHIQMPAPKDQTRLMEVAAKYANRADMSIEDNSNVNPSEIVGYYDKFKWNLKEQQRGVNGSGFNRGRMNTRRKTDVESVELPPLGENIEPSAKEKLLRYVNGTVRHKRKPNTNAKEGKSSFYIKFHGPNRRNKKDGDVAGMIKFERKREVAPSGGEPVDRWVARVIIKNVDQAGDGAKAANSTSTTSSVVVVKETRWPRKQGVAESERERLLAEMQRNRAEQKVQIEKRKKKQEAGVGMKQEPRKPFRVRPRESRVSSFSLVETAKVKMRYDVETTAKKGVVRTAAEQQRFQADLTPPLPAISGAGETPAPNEGGLTIGKDQVTKIAPQLGEGSRETEYSRTGRLFLNRGAAQRSERSRAGPKPPPRSRLRLPSLQRTEGDAREPVPDAGGPDDEAPVVEDGKGGNLPVITGMAVNGEAPEEGARPQTPSSTFNSDVMMRQVVDTAHFLKKAPEQNAEFIRYRVIQQPGLYPSGPGSSKSKEGAVRKPLHPPHAKNRGQERIQGMIGHEKALVRSVIEQLTVSGALGTKPHTLNHVGSEGQDFKTALTTAFAKAKLLEEKKASRIPTNLMSSNRGHVIMKRRVVPPIISTGTVAKQQRNTAAPPGGQTKQQPLPSVATTRVGTEGDIMFKDGAVAGSVPQPRKKKKAVPPAPRRLPERPVPTARAPSDDVMLDDFICSGDVLIKQRPTPKLLQHNFAASIKSVKPRRRVVNREVR